MAKTFDLGNTLADVLKNVSEPDAREQIEYIPLQNLVSDERNFYSMDGVDELAANIELIGLQQPLRVLAGENGFYVIVSGHRRAAAIRILAEDAPEKWARVPCIVEKPGGSPELEELRLIMANADTRRMSSADLAKQAERVKMLLYKLKKQGMEFPGRMRDHVAEACKVSATKLAQLKVIREKLIPELREHWEAGRLVESCAYRIAQETPEIQKQLLDDSIEKGIDITQSPEWSISQWFLDRKRKLEYGLKPVQSEPAFDPEAYGRQLEKERRLLRRAIEEQWLERLCGNIVRGAVPQNRMEAIDRLKRCYRHAGTGGMKVDYDGAPNGLYVRWQHEAKFLARYTDVFDQLALVAIGELHRRFEEDRKKPKSAPTVSDAQRLISVDDRYPDEGQYVFAYKRDFTAIPSVYFRAAFMDCEERSVANNRLTGIEYWSPRPQLPAGKKWPGQEIIEEMVKK